MFKSRILSRKRAGIYKKDTDIRERAGRAGRAGKNDSENKKNEIRAKIDRFGKKRKKFKKICSTCSHGKKEMRKRYYYRICEKCGAALDPGERCDCEREEN